MLAKTAAAGSTSLLPEVLTFTTSLEQDRNLLFEDLVGSLAHLTMLSRTRLIPGEMASALKRGLLSLWSDAAAGTLTLPAEEDVHMAIEAALSERVGAAAGFLHTGRSRNDQVALALRLFVRERIRLTTTALLDLLALLADRAEQERDTLMPAYTHRQRAQPISAAYWLLGHAFAIQRDVTTLLNVHAAADELPLGVGAIAGSSLPLDRELVRSLLKFRRLTANGLDTVGDRDFVLDFAFAASKFAVHASRLSTDVIDFSAAEFGFLKLDGEIACGSSMMPQKRNPDVFELIRGKAGPQLGELVALLVTVKGLPGGYNRDLQEDRGPLLGTAARLESVARMLALALPRVQFDREKTLKALTSDATQATDVAEALVRKGHPFRVAYKATGALVRACQEKGLPLQAATLELAKSVDPAFDADVLAVLRVEGSVARKTTPGSTGPGPVEQQIAQLRAFVAEARAAVAALPSLASLREGLEAAAL